jgi:hypothetical protein
MKRQPKGAQPGPKSQNDDGAPRGRAVVHIKLQFAVGASPPSQAVTMNFLGSKDIRCRIDRSVVLLLDLTDPPRQQSDQGRTDCRQEDERVHGLSPFNQTAADLIARAAETPPDPVDR